MVAEDVATGKLVLKVEVFHTRIRFWIEEDTQWVFITHLKVVDKSLIVRDARASCHSVELTRNTSRNTSATTFFTRRLRRPRFVASAGEVETHAF